MIRLGPTFLLLTCLLCTCDRAQTNETGSRGATGQRHEISGQAMGSYYRITYLGDSIPFLTGSVDSLLDAYNLELSAWVPESKLSQFNERDSGVDLRGTQHFIPNLELAIKISRETDGAYDPTVAPLVNYWGFGAGERRTSTDYDVAEIARLRTLVGLENIELKGERLTKKIPGVQLDVSASAKGYGVDLVSELMSARGRPNHLVDIGGEMRGGGTKDGAAWNVAIRLPDEDKTKIASAGTLPLMNGRALATSGNYLNYYKVDGETYSHTINPKTGMVERNTLLSASVLAPDCATADAYATACMVLGPEKALRLIEARPEMEGYFLTRGDDGTLVTLKSSGL
ncbi:FAD:protein FMN transferase [Neolewinella antarctica]|uniref:FAD:protein FMN transferase n=1 Tax=Neolewinella antarctica TaxID=442734 RepID=A0ABX0XAW8_9BACT|nr:FAD:protein FMN transferase [Neolewinella antarctica]NJC26084.1 thiamine biosynthesis lipoprotein [Neolewinella antarctica]